jgi:hypothetical protein
MSKTEKDLLVTPNDEEIKKEELINILADLIKKYADRKNRINH